MKPNVSKDLLALLLEGKIPDAGDVDGLLSETEDQYIDFKAASDGDSMKVVIRRWITGFANADGGILALGISSKREATGTITRSVSGVPPEVAGRATLDEWANNVLQPLAGRFSPSPVSRTVTHDKGLVLLIATARVPELISYDGTKYALRVHDATVDVPEYLLVDLVLGRRRHPVLEIRTIEFEKKADLRTTCLELSIERIQIENRSLVHAEETEVGIVAWSLVAGLPEEPSRQLLQYVEAVKPTDTFSQPKGYSWSTLQSTAWSGQGSFNTFRPFDVKGLGAFVAHLPKDAAIGSVEFAIYILPRGSPPVWYQVSVRYNLVETVQHVTELGFTTPKLKEVVAGKPRLHWANT